MCVSRYVYCFFFSSASPGLGGELLRMSVLLGYTRIYNYITWLAREQPAACAAGANKHYQYLSFSRIEFHNREGIQKLEGDPFLEALENGFGRPAGLMLLKV